ncbi:MAG: hypothetical protein LQ350_005477 [Teloschistes chrysophthalmus]|nr:MAG: hypothetical protein LQ350_005477 [Niorma chrysophthalma]
MPEDNQITKFRWTWTEEADEKMEFVPYDDPIVKYDITIENLDPSEPILDIFKEDFLMNMWSANANLLITLGRQAHFKVEDDWGDDEHGYYPQYVRNWEMDKQERVDLFGRSKNLEEVQVLGEAFKLWDKEMENLFEKAKDWDRALIFAMDDLFLQMR